MARLLLLAAALVFIALPVRAQDAETPRNVILFIADGGGPATWTMARDHRRWETGDPTAELTLDDVQVGSVRTSSSDSRVTDSAASATAYATGQKTYNGAIAVDTLRRPLATLLEAAEAQGMATGLVATSRITHATPASFSAHVPSRGMEDEIAAQQIEAGIEVLMGGGRRHFTSTDAGGRRDDGRDLLAEAEGQGYQVVRTRDELMQADATPVLALFADGHMAYEIDRDPMQEPSLREMTEAALALLDDASDEGFFLMVEGSRIDHAAHSNDAAAHLHDALAYDEALEAALAFAEEHEGTLVVSTSDHETGGLTLGREVDGRGIYAWHPDVLDRVTASHGVMTRALTEDRLPADEVLRDLAGFDDVTEQEVAAIDTALAQNQRLDYVLSELIGRRAVIGWTTGGHTAVDVPLFAAGPGAETLAGSLENDEFGRLLAQLLGVDLEALTAERFADAVGTAPEGE